VRACGVFGLKQARNFVLDRQVQTVKDGSALIGLINDFTDL